MIHEIKINDVTKVNNLLKHFNYKITDEVFKQPFFNGVVYDEDEIKGVLIYSEIYDRIEIEYIIVKEEFLNKKIASKLMEWLIFYSKNNNILNITLEVNVNNKRAINLYKKFQFKEILRRKNYYGNDDAIVMIRKFDKNE